MHNSELAVITKDTLSVFDGFSRKTIITLGTEQGNSSGNPGQSTDVICPGGTSGIVGGNPYVPGGNKATP